MHCLSKKWAHNFKINMKRTKNIPLDYVPLFLLGNVTGLVYIWLLVY